MGDCDDTEDVRKPCKIPYWADPLPEAAAPPGKKLFGAIATAQQESNPWRR